MIKKKLTEKEYYLSNMSMFMKESFGVTEQMEIFLDWLKSVDNISEVLIECYDIWKEEYKHDLRRKILSSADFKPLDNLASLMGIQRDTKITWYTDALPSPIRHEETLHFSNNDLIDLIKIHIIQNNYKGTTQELTELYKEKLKYSIYFVPSFENSSSTMYKSAYCDVYLEKTKTNGEEISLNIQKMFKYSDLLLRSLGIEYNALFVDSISNILRLDFQYTDPDQFALYSNDFKPTNPDALIVLG